MRGNPAVRQVVRYRNRKLYEPAERRFVTIQDLARAVAEGGKVEVRSADTGEEITATILSRALAADRSQLAPTTDALTRLLRAGSDAAATVAGVVEKAGATRVAEQMRRAAAPERLAETIAPLTRRVDGARVEVERIVGGLVSRGRLSWEEGARLREDVGAVFGDALSEVIGRVRDLTGRLTTTGATPELAREIADLRTRLDQLEALATASFPGAVETPQKPPRANGARRRTKAADERRKP